MLVHVFWGKNHHVTVFHSLITAASWIFLNSAKSTKGGRKKNKTLQSSNAKPAKVESLFLFLRSCTSLKFNFKYCSGLIRGSSPSSNSLMSCSIQSLSATEEAQTTAMQELQNCKLAFPPEVSYWHQGNSFLFCYSCPPQTHAEHCTVNTLWKNPAIFFLEGRRGRILDVPQNKSSLIYC